MTEFNPEQRRVLAKAPDSEVHPTLPRVEKIEELLTRRGVATSDTLRTPKAEKLVPLIVEVPKSLRKTLRTEAERLGMSVDQVVTNLLRERLG